MERGVKMNKQEAYEIVNAIGGICATKEEVDEALKVLTKEDKEVSK